MKKDFTKTLTGIGEANSEARKELLVSTEEENYIPQEKKSHKGISLKTFLFLMIALSISIFHCQKYFKEEEKAKKLFQLQKTLNRLAQHYPLEKLPEVTTLSLSIRLGKTPGLEHLKELPALRTLEIKGFFNSFLLKPLGKLKKLEHLILNNDIMMKSFLKEKELLLLAEMEELASLSLHHIEIEKDGFVVLGQFTTLTKLVLENSLMISEDLKKLKKLAKLSSLKLIEPRLKNKGLYYLRNFPLLMELELRCPLITDEGIRSLKELKKLTRLILVNTQITNEGIKELQKELPLCFIEKLQK